MLNIKRGINIGDHFEDESVAADEFVNPVQDWYFEKIPALGFDHVRIPVRWSVHCDRQNGWKIDGEFMETVAETVQRFLDTGISVILNIHHFREAAEHPKQYEQELMLLWDQIGERFSGFSERLIFEVLNEPRWNVEPAEWNEVQTALVSRIRRTNPDRYLMIGGVCFNDVFHMNLIDVPKNDSHLIGTFHYYYPMEFTHQGAPWTEKYIGLHDIKWTASEQELADMDSAFALAAEWMKKYNLPANLGEFGAYKKADIKYRALYTETVRRHAEALGISWTYWELNRNFGLFDKDSNELNLPLLNALSEQN